MSMDIENDIRPATHMFLGLLAAMVVAFLIWSAVGKLEVVSDAMGEVIPSTQVKSVQHLEGGIVRAIHVQEGERVEAGQPLVELEPTVQGADVEEIHIRMASLRATLSRLEAEAAGEEAPSFPEDLTAQHPELVAEMLDLFKTRRQRLEAQVTGQRETIIQRQQQLREISSRLENRRANLKHINEQVRISEELLRDDLTNRMLHLNLLKEQGTLRGGIGEDEAALLRTRAAINEAEAKLKNIQSSHMEDVRKDLEKNRREYDEFSSRVTKYADSLQRTVLRSPVQGVVKALYVHTIGGVIRPGETVLDVVPEGDRLVVEARLPVQDVGYVHPGQSAVVKLASIDAMRFGDLEGTVVTVSPDAIRDEQGVPYYRVRIETENDYFERNSLRYRLLPGVQVLCSIRTGERTVLEYMIDPFLAASRRAMRER